MCQTGNFKFDVKPAVVAPKHDKKEVSVWKLPDGVSKPDFRHWIDGIDIQLEVIHGFVYPDLVFEKIKRLPTEVTVASLTQAIAHQRRQQEEVVGRTDRSRASGTSWHGRH